MMTYETCSSDQFGISELSIATIVRVSNSTQESSMSSNTVARLQVASLIFSMVNAVLFGAGLMIVLSIPTLAQHAFFWISAVVLASFVLAAPLAWLIAPSMMQRYLKAKTPPLAARLARQAEGDV
jgi:hypothetical protein